MQFVACFKEFRTNVKKLESRKKIKSLSRANVNSLHNCLCPPPPPPSLCPSTTISLHFFTQVSFYLSTRQKTFYPSVSHCTSTVPSSYPSTLLSTVPSSYPSTLLSTVPSPYPSTLLSIVPSSYPSTLLSTVPSCHFSPGLPSSLLSLPRSNYHREQQSYHMPDTCHLTTIENNTPTTCLTPAISLPWRTTIIPLACKILTSAVKTPWR